MEMSDSAVTHTLYSLQTLQLIWQAKLNNYCILYPISLSHSIPFISLFLRLRAVENGQAALV